MDNKNSKWFDNNGYLSEEGKNAMSDFNMGLALLLDRDNVRDMSVDELQVLGYNLHKIVGDAIFNRIVGKQNYASKLQGMTDEQFEDHLKARYGDSWQFMTLSPEEMDRAPVLTQEKVEELLKEGAKHVSDMRRGHGFIWPKESPRFRK